MSVTQADIDALERALFSGTLTVKHRDKQVTYQSADQMMKVRDRMKAELAQQTGSARPAATLTTFRRGF